MLCLFAEQHNTVLCFVYQGHLLNEANDLPKLVQCCLSGVAYSAIADVVASLLRMNTKIQSLSSVSFILQFLGRFRVTAS